MPIIGRVEPSSTLLSAVFKIIKAIGMAHVQQPSYHGHTCETIIWISLHVAVVCFHLAYYTQSTWKHTCNEIHNLTLHVQQVSWNVIPKNNDYYIASVNELVQWSLECLRARRYTSRSKLEREIHSNFLNYEIYIIIYYKLKLIQKWKFLKLIIIHYWFFLINWYFLRRTLTWHFPGSVCG